MKKEVNPVLAGMLEKVEGFRAELATYGETLESSTVSSEQTSSYEVATNALNTLESALKSLGYDELQRTA